MKKLPNIWFAIFFATLISVGLSFVLPKNEEQFLSRRFWVEKTFAPARYDVVIMGDSRVYRGVSPAIMEAKLKPLKVLNFGYSNGGLNPEMFNAAENKLNGNNHQKVIVLGISANTITGYSQDNKQYRQELHRSWEERFEAMYLNTMKYWFSPVTPEQLKDSLMHHKEKSYYRNHYFMTGYVASEKFPVDTMEAIASYQKDFSRFKVENRYLDELYSQVKNWYERGIIVIGFRPPIPVPMRELERVEGNYNERQLSDDFERAGGIWLVLNPGLYNTYDGSHLTIESAQKLSARLADEIGHLLIRK